MSSSENEILELVALSQLGDSDATLSLAEHYRANGADNDVVEATYRLSTEQGSSVAALSLGNFYEFVLHDARSAVIAYEKACSMGCGLACNYLGLAYLAGNLGLEQDFALAQEFIDRANNLE